LRLTVTTAQATIGSSFLILTQRLEGLRIADLLFGTANAKTAVLQFGVRAPAGTYSVSLLDPASSVQALSTFTISAGEANTDVVRTAPVSGLTSGAFTTNNTMGAIVRFYTALSGQANLLATNGNVFELFDVGLYEGTVAPAFQVPDYASELALCQRYMQLPLTGSNFGIPGFTPTTALARVGFVFRSIMRATPTLLVQNAAAINVNTPTLNVAGTSVVINSAGTGAATLDITCTAAGFTAGQACTAGCPSGSVLFSARL
jgi:hypothetical protein